MDARSEIDIDNSLRGQGGPGLTKWMKRGSERYEYHDYCSSPPSHMDGFFHIEKRNGPGLIKPVECFENQRKKSTVRALEEVHSGIGSVGVNSSSIVAPPPPPTANIMNPDGNKMIGPNTQDCLKSTETTSFFKSVTSSSLASLATNQAAGLMTLPGNVFKGGRSRDNSCGDGNDPKQQQAQTQPKFRATETNSTGMMRNIQSAPAMRDNTSSSSTSSESGKKIVGRPSSDLAVSSVSPETTPFSTPGVTPSASPQVQRRGNPFFAGTITGASNAGSWLFRPANINSYEKSGGDRGNVLYEPRLDLPSNQTADISQKKVRYVPRPSQLREINFWSPTSM